MRTTLVSLVTCVLLSAATYAQEHAWLPPNLAEGVARQLADRTKQLGLGPAKDEQKLLAGARQMVFSMRDDLEDRGEEGISRLAPHFSSFDLPRAGQRELDLMARYNICNLVLFRQFQDPAFRDDLNARVTSTLGLTALTLIVAYLRQRFVAEGNDPARVEAHLTDERLQPIFDRIQTEPDVRAGVERSCRPVITSLLEEPLSKLGGK